MTKEKWIRQLAVGVREKLDSPRFFGNVGPVCPSHWNGLWLSLAQVRSGFESYALVLFIDESSGYDKARLWYGFCSKSEQGLQALTSAVQKQFEPVKTRESLERPLDRKAFGRPISEPNMSKRQHYYGIYVWQIPNLNELAPTKLIRKIVTFANTVADRLPSRSLSPHDADDATSDDSNPEARINGSIRLRRGQTRFRKRLLKAYESSCCVSGSRIVAILEAAHVRTFSCADLNSLSNGLLLRADLHTLFDLELLKIHPDDLQVHIAESLKASEYWKEYHRRPLAVSSNVAARLNREALRERWGAPWGTA